MISEETDILCADLKQAIKILISQNNHYAELSDKVFESNKEKNLLKKEICNDKFKKTYFYVDKGHPLRKTTIHYQVLHGLESRIAASGLRENHFKEISENSKFKEMMSYVYPPSIGKNDWNLNDENIFMEYCHGIFEFKIPQYTEAMPMRLASYFYPDYFFPIFKLDSLEKICTTLGLKSECKTKGDKLFKFTRFLLSNEELKSIPYDNYIKMYIIYQLFYTVKLCKELKKGKKFNQILAEHKKKWEKENLKVGRELLNAIKV